MLGPFAGGADGYDAAAVAGEASLAPALGETVGGTPWRYFDDRYYCRSYDDYNDLYTFFMDGREGGPGGGAANSVAYCGTYIWSPAEQSVTLRFRARGRAKVWLNGEITLEQPEARQAQRDAEMAAITLNAGWNTVLVKAVGGRRAWGFYFNLTDREGRPVNGLAYSPDTPSTGTLDVVTPGLPDGYNDQPYVWLDVRNPGGDFPWENPSASPFRLLARGGTPPYHWQVDGLPEGLTLDAAEGELGGRSGAVGAHRVLVRVRDSASPPLETSGEYTLHIRPRPTELWWETGNRLGSLRHHGGSDETHWAWDHAAEQIGFLTRQGYDWQAYTAFSFWHKDNAGAMQIAGAPEMLAYRDALRAAGIRFAQYINVHDYRDIAPDALGHVDNMHEALELFMRQNEPVLWWFDSSLALGKEAVEFDVLFSLIRTLDPDCLITVNNDIRARDYECGDLDILQVHGSFQTDSYWGHWPPTPLLGNNPKYMPVDSWKLPWKEYMDAAEWCKVIVSMLAEPANLEAPRSVDLDTTPTLEGDYHMVNLHRAIAEWLEPRKDSILGTLPLSATHYDWGYVVRQPRTGDIYLHVLSNGVGKRGLFERRLLDVAPVAEKVLAVELAPGGDAVSFAQEGKRLTVDMQGVPLDAVDTILRVVVR
ncbi:MAG: hypothetical protein KF886_06505 [Candidatus Hydrogenedentes bacterium]|nr:hypothetical protein [Candidatus Hydrogenedentota bacterium]